eukprot:659748-Rhodomonas_salina.1
MSATGRKMQARKRRSRLARPSRPSAPSPLEPDEQRTTMPASHSPVDLRRMWSTAFAVISG